jgi:hypothetical protein
MARIVGKNKTLAASLSMSNGQCNKKGAYKHIQLNDVASGLRIATISISHEEFGKALSSVVSGKENCEVELILNDDFGKTMEIKTETVVVQWESYDNDDRREELIKAVAPLEVCGWVADLYINSRRHNHKTKEYPVVFRRYVKKELE